jgi:hypothetical protein
MGGLKLVVAEGWKGAVLSGLIYTAIAFVTIFLIRLIIAPFLIHKEGKWHGQKFVESHPKQLRRFKSCDDLRYTRGSIRVNRNRDLCLSVFMRKDADPISIRIYVSGWDESADEPPRPVSDKAPPAYWA